MSVFFSFVPRLYYILPWRLRLIPDYSSQMDLEEEGEDLTEEEKREIEQDESHAGSTMLEGSFSIANSRMWMLGLSHILTRKISVGYNFEQSLVPVRQARIDRKKHNFMVRHDVSKETSTRISYSLTHRHCA